MQRLSKHVGCLVVKVEEVGVLIVNSFFLLLCNFNVYLYYSFPTYRVHS